MASHQDEAEAGPSGLSVEDMLALLGLDTSEVLVEEEDDPSEPDEEEPSLTCHEVLGESDEALDRPSLTNPTPSTKWGKLGFLGGNL